MAEKRSPGVSRRDLLKGASMAGAAAAAGVAPANAAPGAAAPLEPGAAQAPAQAAREPVRPRVYEHLTAEEAELLEAIADHLIPADENGPGALEAGAVRYIDRSLGGAQSESRDAYRTGLAAFDRYCRSSRGGPFTELERTDQLSALIDLETGGATGARVGFVGSSAAFFGMLRSHVLHGTFGDPHYGGNVDFVGWDLLGYPGVRVSVTTSDQRRLEAGELTAQRRSAYDWDSFVRSEDGDDR
jgi:gluconate 2-dehydrogenase gamma chain